MLEAALQAIPIPVIISTLGLTTAVIIFTFFIRRTVETAFPFLKKKSDENDTAITYTDNYSRWWNKVVLYLIPVFLGVIGSFYLPEINYESIKLITTSSKMLFGISIGWMSGFIWKVFRQVILKNTGVVLPDLSASPSFSPDNPPDNQPSNPPEAG